MTLNGGPLMLIVWGSGRQTGPVKRECLLAVLSNGMASLMGYEVGSDASESETTGHPASVDGVEFDIGRRLRDIRKRQRLTLDVLARHTGFTKGYLSKIERGRKVPPIASLARISRALGADVAELLQPLDDESSNSPASNHRLSVVRANERQHEIRGASSFGYDYQALAHKIVAKHMQPFIMTFPVQLLKEIYFEHDGEEMMFILSGMVELEVGGERATLSPGDCVYFDSSLPHRGRGVNGEAKALLVIYSPEGVSTG